MFRVGVIVAGLASAGPVFSEPCPPDAFAQAPITDGVWLVENTRLVTEFDDTRHIARHTDPFKLTARFQTHDGSLHIEMGPIALGLNPLPTGQFFIMTRPDGIAAFLSVSQHPGIANSALMRCAPRALPQWFGEENRVTGERSVRGSVYVLQLDHDLLFVQTENDQSANTPPFTLYETYLLTRADLSG